MIPLRNVVNIFTVAINSKSFLCTRNVLPSFSDTSDEVTHDTVQYDNSHVTLVRLNAGSSK